MCKRVFRRRLLNTGRRFEVDDGMGGTSIK